MADSNGEVREVAAFAAGLAVGALVGAGVALLYAPQSGRRMRGKLRRSAEDFTEAAEEKARYAAEDVRHAAEDAKKAAEESGRRMSEKLRGR